MHKELKTRRSGCERSELPDNCLVASDDTIGAVQKAIINLRVVYIQFSVKHDNLDYLFQPAPEEVWAEYFASAKDPSSSFQTKKLVVLLDNWDKCF